MLEELHKTGVYFSLHIRIAMKNGEFSSVKVWWLTPVTLGFGNRRKKIIASLSSACFSWWVLGQPGLQSEFLSCFKMEQTELSSRIIRAASFPFGESILF